MTPILLGAVLFIAAAATSLWPERLNLILTLDSPGANEVFIPVAYWATVVMVAALMSRRAHQSFRRLLARTFIAAFAIHMLLLLCVSATRNLDRNAYASIIYFVYARLFYVAAVAASISWGKQIQLRHDERVTAVAAGLAGASLAIVTTWRDPTAGLAGMIIGVMMASQPTRGWARSPLRFAREFLSNDRAVIGSAFALSLGLRLSYTVRVMSDPNYLETGPDARVYDQVAWGIANGGAPILQGYPLLILGHVRFLAGIYWLFGHNYLAVCIVQSLIGAATVAAVYAVGKPVFGATASLIAILFAAVNFQLTFWAAAIGYQALDIGLTMFLVLLLIRSVDQPKTRWWVWALAGAAFGFAISVRETTVTFFAFACAWVAWMMRRHGSEAWRAITVMSLGTLVVLLPMIAPMVATPEQRQAMRGHFDRLASGSQVVGHEGLREPMSDPAAALGQLREQPGFVLRGLAMGVLNNITRQFMTQPYGAFDLASLRKGTEYYYGVWCYAYLLTLVGMIVTAWRIYGGHRFSGAMTMILGVIVSRTLVHLYLQSGYRHRAPLEPFLILLCAAGLTSIFQASHDQPSELGDRADSKS